VATTHAGSAPSCAAGRHLLLVTFHYPPSNTSSGGLRPLKFGKYLPQFGWDTSVLTVPAECHESVDPALVGEIPRSVRVHRAFCFDTKRKLAIAGKYPGFIAVPDRYISWLPFGVVKALRVIRGDGISALCSTSPIPTAHLIALIVKKMTKLPWVADFRDPWVETEGSEVYGPLRQRFELWLERQVITGADRVVVTTPEFGQYLEKRYGRSIEGKICVVYNGYDEEDLQDLTPDSDDPERFTILHAGLLDPHYRNPLPILRALRHCLDRELLPARARVTFIGGGAYANEALPKAIAELRLSDNVELVGRIPYRQALAKQAGASALLLMQGGDDTWMLIPAKAFEYLRTGRLILATAPADSATGRLVSEFDGTFLAKPDDADDIAHSLTALYQAWRGGLCQVERAGVTRLSRRSTAAELATVLDAITVARVPVVRAVATASGPE
jgi:glycosyltransferase involved in cell wall biosynthesis